MLKSSTGTGPRTDTEVTLMDKSLRTGGVKVPLLLWILGVPIPIVLIVLLFTGC